MKFSRKEKRGSDPAVNKVGYLLTRKEMDQLDDTVFAMRKIFRERYDVKITKNDVVRACLAIGLQDWQDKQLTSHIAEIIKKK